MRGLSKQNQGVYVDRLKPQGIGLHPLGLCRGMSAARTRSEDQRPLSKYLKDQCGSQDTRELVALMQGVF